MAFVRSSFILILLALCVSCAFVELAQADSNQNHSVEIHESDADWAVGQPLLNAEDGDERTLDLHCDSPRRCRHYYVLTVPAHSEYHLSLEHSDLTSPKHYEVIVSPRPFTKMFMFRSFDGYLTADHDLTITAENEPRNYYLRASLPKFQCAHVSLHPVVSNSVNEDNKLNISAFQVKHLDSAANYSQFPSRLSYLSSLPPLTTLAEPTPSEPIQLDQDVSSTLTFLGDKLYLFTSSQDLPSGSVLNFAALVPKGRAYVLFSASSQPTLFNNDHSYGTIDEKISFKLPIFKSTAYYMRTSCLSLHCEIHFRIHIDAIGPACHSNCSGEMHGVCKDATCVCKDGFVGTSCEYKLDNLTNLVPVQGFMGQGSWNYYRAQAELTSVFNILLTVATGSIRIYVSASAYPNKSTTDFMDVQSPLSLELREDKLMSQLFYIGLYANQDSNYSVSIRLDTTCPPSCIAPHGSCIDHSSYCTCSPAYTGSDCQQLLEQLEFNVLTQSKIVDSHSVAYTFTPDAFDYIIVSLLEDGLGNGLSMTLQLVDANGIALQSWISKDHLTDTNVRILTISKLEKVRPDYRFILTIAPTPAALEFPIAFSLIYWSSPL